ncbi:BREX-1 system adenine-specific DNA-methyltransferase PglX [Sulfuricurvum sp.]|uniref:BREX-1 system adenine-specific DNA-methyltransferase PglX n=1 Tax=Sulfuricurvum sp. TaxID=2025608 RepID=UPI002621F71B|nr:BREX-1 system adenine-specific DNA-methyltransferase PglX [Sulfuricurvum sp.]MDD4950491.1 BREX-1 system adenine-specific DNA-methyltransferase PglX [Sulfuricurvum sp.]
METTKLKRFAQHARITLIDTVKTKLELVLHESSNARREHPQAIEKLQQEIVKSSKDQVIDKVAYIWFNRFIALRFMDVNRYTKLNIVSPEPGQFQPTILSDAKMGHVDESLVSDTIKEKVLALLDNRTPSKDPQGEAYKLLIVSTCNYYSHAMPFLFEHIADYTELLMPDDLLSGTSILSYVREAMTPDVCKDVEVIGWLYQFYISEKKDQVFEGIKNNKKVTPENIPAATQLFTPHWIVQYMVENSLGRLWMLNNPSSKLIEKMDYYVKPKTPESDYLKIASPQELKVCDPACGSGHILVYAFDLLYEIYKEEGIDESSIAELILKYNLFGIEIDERAAELAAFALAMKAASRSESKRRFFRNPIEVNICKLETISFSDEEIGSYMNAIGRDLFTSDLQTTLKQFEEADNFGSLIQPAVKDVTVVLQTLKEKNVSHDLFLAPTHEKVLQVLEQADYLSQKYHVVVANPPYMGGKGMSESLKVFLSDNFEDGKSDLFSAFIIRNTILALPKGQLGFMTPFTWMFITSYEKLREFIINNKTLTSLIQLEYSGFDGATVPICTFTLQNTFHPEYLGGYIKLSNFKGSDNQSPRTLEAIKNNDCGWFYNFIQSNFKKIPGMAISYWASDNFIKLMESSKILTTRAVKGLDTGGNIDLFLKRWHEVSQNKISLLNENSDAWYPIAKGGEFRRWYGNHDFVINYKDNGSALKKNKANLRNANHYFEIGATWTVVSSGGFAVRFLPRGFLFDQGGSGIFLEEDDHLSVEEIIGSLNSSIDKEISKMLCPTLNFTTGDIRKFPVWKNDILKVNTKMLISISQKDWDSYEASWDFKSLPIVVSVQHKSTIQESYDSLSAIWQSQVDEMKKLEEENNKIFIEAYGLEDEIPQNVPIKEITLTCNPYYRYDAKKSKEELDALQRADTIKEYISYAVGVMLGRYSLDHDGLHIANQNESIDEANAKFNIQNPTFEADDDNVIPILDGDWFTDDISERFLQFVKVTFGDEHYAENVQFIEDAIGKSIRKYFLKDFYTDHVQRYKSRPIYWMFSSSKGSFQALIYMHRYKSDTVSVILNDYLRNYITKLEATKENLEAIGIKADAPKSEKVKALKDIENIKKMIAECLEYEKEILYPLATQKIEIDLDDGVKVNYPKFGKALKKIVGLS